MLLFSPRSPNGHTRNDFYESYWAAINVESDFFDRTAHNTKMHSHCTLNEDPDIKEKWH